MSHKEGVEYIEKINSRVKDFVEGRSKHLNIVIRSKKHVNYIHNSLPDSLISLLEKQKTTYQDVEVWRTRDRDTVRGLIQGATNAVPFPFVFEHEPKDSMYRKMKSQKEEEVRNQYKPPIQLPVFYMPFVDNKYRSNVESAKEFFTISDTFIDTINKHRQIAWDLMKHLNVDRDTFAKVAHCFESADKLARNEELDIDKQIASHRLIKSYWMAAAEEMKKGIELATGIPDGTPESYIQEKVRQFKSDKFREEEGLIDGMTKYVRGITKIFKSMKEEEEEEEGKKSEMGIGANIGPRHGRPDESEDNNNTRRRRNNTNVPEEGESHMHGDDSDSDDDDKPEKTFEGASKEKKLTWMQEFDNYYEKVVVVKLDSLNRYDKDTTTLSKAEEVSFSTRLINSMYENTGVDGIDMINIVLIGVILGVSIWNSFSSIIPHFDTSPEIDNNDPSKIVEDMPIEKQRTAIKEMVANNELDAFVQKTEYEKDQITKIIAGLSAEDQISHPGIGQSVADQLNKASDAMKNKAQEISISIQELNQFAQSVTTIHDNANGLLKDNSIIRENLDKLSTMFGRTSQVTEELLINADEQISLFKDGGSLHKEYLQMWTEVQQNLCMPNASDKIYKDMISMTDAYFKVGPDQMIGAYTTDEQPLCTIGQGSKCIKAALGMRLSNLCPNLPENEKSLIMDKLSQYTTHLFGAVGMKGMLKDIIRGINEFQSKAARALAPSASSVLDKSVSDAMKMYQEELRNMVTSTNEAFTVITVAERIKLIRGQIEKIDPSFYTKYVQEMLETKEKTIWGSKAITGFIDSIMTPNSKDGKLRNTIYAQPGVETLLYRIARPWLGQMGGYIASNLFLLMTPGAQVVSQLEKIFTIMYDQYTKSSEGFSGILKNMGLTTLIQHMSTIHSCIASFEFWSTATTMFYSIQRNILEGWVISRGKNYCGEKFMKELEKNIKSSTPLGGFEILLKCVSDQAYDRIYKSFKKTTFKDRTCARLVRVTIAYYKMVRRMHTTAQPMHTFWNSWIWGAIKYSLTGVLFAINLIPVITMTLSSIAGIIGTVTLLTSLYYAKKFLMDYLIPHKSIAVLKNVLTKRLNDRARHKDPDVQLLIQQEGVLIKDTSDPNAKLEWAQKSLANQFKTVYLLKKLASRSVDVNMVSLVEKDLRNEINERHHKGVSVPKWYNLLLDFAWMKSLQGLTLYDTIWPNLPRLDEPSLQQITSGNTRILPSWSQTIRSYFNLARHPSKEGFERYLLQRMSITDFPLLLWTRIDQANELKTANAIGQTGAFTFTKEFADKLIDLGVRIAQGENIDLVKEFIHIPY
jgi:hypothetical protein